MHNALRWFLLWVLFPFVIVAADPPPPLVRSVLTTNLPAFGNPGEVLTRQAGLPYLTWALASSSDPALSNFVNSCTVALSNLSYTIGANGTNFTLSVGAACSNLAYAIGANDTNFSLSIGQACTNLAYTMLNSNWWWTVYGSTVLTNGGAFIGSATGGKGTNTYFNGLVVVDTNLMVSNTITGSNIWDSSNIRWWGAKGDGVANDAPAISNALNFSSVVYIPPGTFCISNPIFIPSFKKILGAGQSSVIKVAAQTAFNALILSNAESILLSDFKIDGNYPNQTYASSLDNQCCIYAYQCSFSSLRSLMITNPMTAGIAVKGTSQGNQGITVQDCFIGNTILKGILLNTRAEYCRFIGCRVSGVDVGAHVYGGGNNTFTECMFLNNSYGAIVETGAGDNPGKTAFVNCSFNHNGMYGLMVRSVDKVIVTSSQIIANNRHGIYFDGATNCIVSSCIIAANSQSANNTYDEVFMVNGCTNDIFCDNQILSYVSGLRARYGFNESSSDCLYNLYSLNSIYGQATAPLNVGHRSSLLSQSTGFVGIGTNSPQSALHVTGNNSAPNVLQVDTTNRHSLLRVDTNGNTYVSGTFTPTNGIINLVSNSFIANLVIVTNNPQIYCLNGTNQLITLPDCTKIPVGQIMRFSSTNGYGSFTLTNATGSQTIRDGTSLSLAFVGVGEISVFNDGAAWWLGNKTKTIWPNASWSTSTNVPLTVAGSNYVTYNQLETSNGQGITLTNGYQIYVRDFGQYLFTFSIVTQIGAPNATNRIWLQQSGQNVPRTRTDVKMSSTAEQYVMTVNFILPVTTNLTWFGLCVRSTDTGAQLVTGAAGDATMPAMPSAIVTVNKISDTFP